MSVNDPFLFGLNMVELFSIPVMICCFAVAVWYGVFRGADGSPVLWGEAEKRAVARARRAAPERPRKAA